MKINGKVLAIVCAGAVVIAGSAGAYAYYSDSAATVENTFNIVAGEQDQNAAGTITESNWGNDEEHQNLKPGDVVAKNPALTSNVDYDSWVFLKIDIPAVSAMTTGDKEENIYKAAFLSFDGETEGVDSENWTLINSVEPTESYGTYTYYYGYKKPVEKGETTTELFRYIIIPDFIKIGYFEGSIDISGSLIQSAGFETLTDAAKELGIID